MARQRHSPDQILAKLRDADVMLADGRSLAEVAKKLEVSEQTYHTYRNVTGLHDEDAVRSAGAGASEFSSGVQKSLPP